MALIKLIVGGEGFPLLADLFTGYLVEFELVADGVFHIAFFAESAPHFDVIILFIGADQLNLDIAIFNLGFDADGIIGAVLEREVGAAPADRCVRAHGHIGGNEAVGTALNDFQIGKQCAVVQGGGNLTDTTAQGLNCLTVGIRIRLSVALCCGTFTHNSVEVEDIAGQKDNTSS